MHASFCETPPHVQHFPNLLGVTAKFADSPTKVLHYSVSFSFTAGVCHLCGQSGDKPCSGDVDRRPHPRAGTGHPPSDNDHHLQPRLHRVHGPRVSPREITQGLVGSSHHLGTGRPFRGIHILICSKIKYSFYSSDLLPHPLK